VNERRRAKKIAVGTKKADIKIYFMWKK
jgi:hypothetical protein